MLIARLTPFMLAKQVRTAFKQLRICKFKNSTNFFGHNFDANSATAMFPTFFTKNKQKMQMQMQTTEETLEKFVGEHDAHNRLTI